MISERKGGNQVEIKHRVVTIAGKTKVSRFSFLLAGDDWPC